MYIIYRLNLIEKFAIEKKVVLSKLEESCTLYITYRLNLIEKFLS